MFFCLQAVQNSPSPDTSRTEEASGSSGAVLSSLSIFCFLFLFYQLCVLFILLINLICQIAYLVISFIATVCDSRQFSGNSDVTMKLFKTRRNLVMVKINLIKKNKNQEWYQMMDFVLFLSVFYNPGHCKHTETKSKGNRGSGRDQVGQGEVRSFYQSPKFWNLYVLRKAKKVNCNCWRFETQLIKIKTEICMLEQSIGAKKRKLEQVKNGYDNGCNTSHSGYNNWLW